MLVLRANRGFFDSVSSVGVGGQLVVRVFWRVVSVGSKRLSLCSQMDTCVAILLDLLFLGLCHGNPLGLGVLGLGGDDLGDSGGGVQRSGYTAAPQTCSWSCSVLVAMISGTARAVFSVPLPQQLLRLVPGPAQ